MSNEVNLKSKFMDARFENEVKSRMSDMTINHFEELSKYLTGFDSVVNYSERKKLANDVEDIAKSLRELQVEFYSKEKYTPGKLVYNMVQLVKQIDAIDAYVKGDKKEKYENFQNEYHNLSFIEASYLLLLNYEQYKKVTSILQKKVVYEFEKNTQAVKPINKTSKIINFTLEHYNSYKLLDKKINFVYNDDLKFKYTMSKIDEIVNLLCVYNYLVDYKVIYTVIKNRTYEDKNIMAAFNLIYHLNECIDLKMLFN